MYRKLWEACRKNFSQVLSKSALVTTCYLSVCLPVCLCLSVCPSVSQSVSYGSVTRSVFIAIKSYENLYKTYINLYKTYKNLYKPITHLYKTYTKLQFCYILLCFATCKSLTRHLASVCVYVGWVVHKIRADVVHSLERDYVAM